MPKIHYNHGCELRWIVNPQYLTDVIADVTCKFCLRIIKKKGLRPRSDFPEIPTFIAERKYGGLVFTCPVCGREHVHALRWGHASSFCFCWEKGYYINE